LPQDRINTLERINDSVITGVMAHPTNPLEQGKMLEAKKLVCCGGSYKLTSPRVFEGKRREHWKVTKFLDN